MKKIVAGSTAVLLMLTASGALIGCKSAPDEATSSSDSSLESTSNMDSDEAEASATFDIEEDDDDEISLEDEGSNPSGDSVEGQGGQEGSAERISSDGLEGTDHRDEDGKSGTGNSYGLASGEGIDGDGIGIKGGTASDTATKGQESAPNDEENFPATMERMKGTGKTTSADDGKNGQGDSASSATAGEDSSDSKSGGSRQSAVAPNANDASSAGTGKKAS
ncbi:MAG: hypothetical protein ILP18_06475, partial [Treponema sp.]|nr:hypothetical protein [Treponema sp.]